MAERAVVFDVNETLLDLKALDPVFERLFGDASARGQWFAQFIQSALLTIAMKRYVPFGQIGVAALKMTAHRRGVELDDAKIGEVMGTVASLPPHIEVHDALAQLRQTGWRIAALTNSTLAVATAQLISAGLIDQFGGVYSADEVQHLKPEPQPYQHAATQLGVGIGELWMVAAHGWDIAGAKGAGMKTAFIARPGAALDPLYPVPDVTGRDLTDVVAQMIAAGE